MGGRVPHAQAAARLLLAVLFASLAGGPTRPSRARGQLVEDYRFKGKIVDTRGRPVPGVQVTFRDVETGARIVFHSHDDGSFDRRMIPSAVYEVLFEKSGFTRRVERFDWSASPRETVVREAQIVLETEAERAKRELGKKAAKLYEEAYAALGAGDCSVARTKAQELLALGAGDWEYAVRFVLARCHAMREELEEAVAEYRRVLEFKPDLFEARFDLAGVLERLGQHEPALEQYARAAELHPEDAEVEYNMGAILFQRQEFDRARPHLEKAVELAPAHAQAHKALGFAHLQGETKDLSAARQHLERYLELAPSAADTGQVREILAAFRSAPGNE